MNPLRMGCGQQALHLAIALCLLLAACMPAPAPLPTAIISPTARATATFTATAPRATPRPPRTPTPAPTHTPTATPTPPRRAAAAPVLQRYLVEAGDTLDAIAARYGTSAADLARANGLNPAAFLDPGSVLLIPIPESHVGSDVLLIPDSGLLNGPGAAGFDAEAYAQAMPGYLKRHSELIEKRITMTGPQIVRMVASRHSVDPRLLLAVIEYRSAWLTDPAPSGDAFKFPAGKRYDETDPQAQEDFGGLFGQLAWVANRLNAGYYGWKGGGLTTVEFGDGSLAYLAAGLNAGTAGVQSFLALESDWEAWQGAVRPAGFMSTYTSLFGDPWSRVAETVPPDLAQPEFTLPWAPGETWYLTGGPHRAWGADTPWASLDFAPDPQSIGCAVSTYWARAVAPGVVVRIDYGQVAVDLDGDGYEGTGWTVLYLHMAPEGRVEVGARLETGDPVGHPSCEGGRSTGAHVHVARRYNGEWLSADGLIPFVMDGWTPVAGAVPYDGYLTKEGMIAWACTCRSGNLITAGP